MRTILKIFTEFVTILLLLCVLVFSSARQVGAELPD